MIIFGNLCHSSMCMKTGSYIKSIIDANIHVYDRKLVLFAYDSIYWLITPYYDVPALILEFILYLVMIKLLFFTLGWLY